MTLAAVAALFGRDDPACWFEDPSVDGWGLVFSGAPGRMATPSASASGRRIARPPAHLARLVTPEDKDMPRTVYLLGVALCLVAAGFLVTHELVWRPGVTESLFHKSPETQLTSIK